MGEIWHPQKIRFLTPLPSVHMRPHGPDPPPPLVDVHTRSTWNTHRSLKTDSRPTMTYRTWSWNSTMIVIYLNCTISNYLLLIHIAEKFPLFIPSKEEIPVKKYTNFFAREEDRMTSVDSNFNFLCGRPHGAWPAPPSTCVHRSLTPSVWTS